MAQTWQKLSTLGIALGSCLAGWPLASLQASETAALPPSLPLSAPLFEQEARMIRNAVPLEGTLWQLTSYVTAEGDTQEALANVEATLQLQAGEISGNDSCNRYFGGYRLEGNQLSFSSRGSTQMACSVPVIQQRQAFQTALDQVDSYVIEGDALRLLNGAGETLLTFTAFRAPTLTNTRWQLVVYNNGQSGLVSPLADTTITATFGNNGLFTGSAGCNRYSARYQLEDTTLSIGETARTRRFCAEPAGVMEQEEAYLQLIQTATRYVLEGKDLVLKNAEGQVVARLQAAD